MRYGRFLFVVGVVDSPILLLLLLVWFARLLVVEIVVVLFERVIGRQCRRDPPFVFRQELVAIGGKKGSPDVFADLVIVFEIGASAEIGDVIVRRDFNDDKEKGRPDFSRRAFEGALELLDLTTSDPKNRTRLKELVRVREALADQFVFDNHYQSSDESWQRYFHQFQYAARADR